MTRLERAAALDNLEHERRSVFLYGALAATESGRAARLFRDLASESEKQGRIWQEKLAGAGESVPPWRPRGRVRLVALLLRALGPRRILPVLAAMKVRGLSIYREGEVALSGQGSEEPEAPAGAGAAAEPAAPTVAERREEVLSGESWHRAAQGGGALRAAVFGVNDGLVSNASLLLGMAGADLEPRVVVLAGAAGLLAGGFSMAAGEYVSVRTQRELLEHQLALEREELKTMPEEEIEELALIYRARGLEARPAERLARRVVRDPVRGLDVLAREELGLDPGGLARPWVAAVASFASFAAGAALPLLPWLLVRAELAFVGTVLVTEAALLGVGALMSLFTGRSALWSALRMALLGSAAGALTHVIGRWLGVRAG